MRFRPMIPAALTIVSALLAVGWPVPLDAQPPVDEKRLADIKARYTKYEYRIPMRDGKRLFTAVYVPKDSTRKYPILLTRTPYSVKPYGADRYRDSLGPSVLFDKAGYIFAFQDVRGRWMSEGEYVNVRPHVAAKNSPKEIDESSDTYDTIDWLLKHVDSHNGKVGIWGISYPGFYTVAGMIDAHPAVAAVSPQAPVVDWFVGDDWHHNGALILTHLFNFMSRFDRPRPQPTKNFNPTFDPETPDGYDFFLKLGPLSEASARYFKGEAAFLKEVAGHGTYDDFWKARNIRLHIKRIRPAVLTVGGWFDAENLFGALAVYRSLDSQSPSTSNQLVMGPWVHGGWKSTDGLSLGAVSFNAKTSEYFRERVEFPFFEQHLKGKGQLARAKAWVFETGTNVWRTYDAWPPKPARPKSLYFHATGKLRDQPPAAARNAVESAFDEYVSDPARPVPFVEAITIGMLKEYMTADQRFAARRPDVLVYSTDPLDQDVAVVGPINVELVSSTTGTDSDFVVKLIDVYPNDYPDPKPNPSGVRMGGYQQLVRGDVVRGKFRSSFERPEPFVPGQPTGVNMTMQDVCHNFRAGHRIMVQVQSTWFPLVDRNPQKFVDIYRAKDADYQKATIRVYHTRDMPSKVTVLTLP